MSEQMYSLCMILVMAGVTALLRILPFAVFSENRRVPKFILSLGNVLPYAVMGMLVVYCLKDITPTAFPFGLPEIIAGAVVVLSYVWKRNTLVSILLGTIVYMILVQFVF